MIELRDFNFTDLVDNENYAYIESLFDLKIRIDNFFIILFLKSTEKCKDLIKNRAGMVEKIRKVLSQDKTNEEIDLLFEELKIGK